MKKQIISLSLASLLAGPTLTHTQNAPTSIDEDTIVLDSSILHIFDGVIIDADVIQSIGFIRREINKILIGEKNSDGVLVGRYTINGTLYSVKDLMHTEEKSLLSETLQKELERCLNEAKKDLQTCVGPFIETIHSVKYQILELIKESCKKRGMDTTILMRWSEAGKGEEARIFNEDITSFTLYNKFCTDLLNFLSDLVRSCPKGMAQFTSRCKMQKISTLIKGIASTRTSTPAASKALEQKFMQHLKEHHIDKLTITEITKERLEALFNKFINQKH